MANIKTLQSLDQLVDIAPKLDRATSHEVYYPSGDASRFRIIKNDTTGAEVCTVSKKYTILQHCDALNNIITGIQAAGITGAGAFRDYNNTVAAELYFDNMQVRDNTQDGHINFGLRFTNSFDKSVGFLGEAFGWRQVCSNGMLMNKMLPNAPSMHFKHLGDVVERVTDSLKDFFQRTLAMEGTILEIIRFESYDQQKLFFVTQLGSEKQSELFIEMENVELEMDQWSIYNAMTSFATHQDLSYSQYNNIHKKAQEFVLQKHIHLPVVENATMPIPGL